MNKNYNQMKKIHTYILMLISLLFTSCQEDILNKEPLDIIGDNAVWDDEILIDTYLSQTYVECQFMVNESGVRDWSDAEMYWFAALFINEVSDECRANWVQRMYAYKMGNLNIGGGLLEWWEPSYAIIRKLNGFIKSVPKAPSLPESFKRQRLAEARFLRAFNYFTLVKRYGGVPLITKVQRLDDPEHELFPIRNKESDIYDFIIEELTDIEDDLEENYDKGNVGRPSKYAALSLKSRSALYAGSIAQFGAVKLNGIVGIDNSKQNAYYQTAYNAAQSIIHSGRFQLYQRDVDKVQNFRNLFLDESLSNREVIFSVLHDGTLGESGGHGWMYDYFQAPQPNAWGLGNQDGPYLEMVEAFEYVDGRAGKLDKSVIESGLWTSDELWKGKDPRFFASIYTQDTHWKGQALDFHNGLILPDGNVQLDDSYNGVLAKGNQRTDATGFGVMKYLDENNSLTLSNGDSKTDYQVFRYGETLLNLAEAAFELGKIDSALWAVNEIRVRAGIKPLTTITREKIRHERKVELAFEGHRYWDVRRWRTAVKDLSVNGSGLRYMLDYNTKKYRLEVIENIDGTGTPPAFYEKNYYLPINLNRTGQNPNLIENPGYK